MSEHHVTRLRELASGREVVLPARLLVGRSRACDLVLPARDVSGQHAELRWTGNSWELHDLGSRNGTYIDGARIPAGARELLRAGARVRFGQESTEWELRGAAAPVALAVRTADDACRIAGDGLLVLPDEQAPQICIYQNHDGVWIAEHDGAPAVVDDRAVLTTADGAAWRVYLPQSCAGTWQADAAPLSVLTLTLRFSFSRDEEYVELLAVRGDVRLDMQARAHHYPLLILARRRLADQRAGLAEADQGWILLHELTSALRMDESHLNICIHRARTQLGKLGVADAAGLVERRPGTKQVRLGVARLELVPLDPDARRS
jgi:hypothetical protein